MSLFKRFVPAAFSFVLSGSKPTECSSLALASKEPTPERALNFALCRFPGCERPADPEAGVPVEVRQCIGMPINAAAEVEYWTLTLGVLKPWIETAQAIGFDRLTEAMERALAETETAAELARQEL